MGSQEVALTSDQW